jgi:PIN domain nuclease of toxin-antitoxin system
VIVIDTHALVWFIQGDPRLSDRGMAAIVDAAAADGVAIPSIMTWEVAMLLAKERLVLPLPAHDWFDRVLDIDGFFLAELTQAIGIDAGMLPTIHDDPADRLMIATARAYDAPLLTADGRILDYAELGHLTAIDARR